MGMQPKLRFKGFTDDWEKRKLGELTKRVTRKNINNESTLPLTISAQYGLIDQNIFFDKQVASKDVSSYFLIKNGEFAYNKSYSNGYPLGAIKRLDRYPNGVLSTLYIIFKPISVSSQFLVSYFDSTHWYKEVAKNAAEGARNHGLLNISPSDFFNMVQTIPNNFEEQNKVGIFFETLDNIIAVNQRKVDLLKKKKAGYLQKLFPRNGQNKPELRFKGYTDAWEKRKLESIFKERTERSSEGTMLSVTINDGVVLANSLSRKNVSSSDKSNYKLVRKDDIAYNSMRMWQSASGVSNYEGIVSPAYTVLIPEHDVNSSFFGYYFKRTVMKQVFQKNSQGLTSDTWNLKYPLLKNIVVQIPSIEEQIKISEFLKQVDKLIAVNQRKVDLLKKEKKSLLQKMFV